MKTQVYKTLKSALEPKKNHSILLKILFNTVQVYTQMHTQVPSVLSTMPNLLTFNATNAVHDSRGVAISAIWSKKHAHSDSYPKIIHQVCLL